MTQTWNTIQQKSDAYDIIFFARLYIIVGDCKELRCWELPQEHWMFCIVAATKFVGRCNITCSVARYCTDVFVHA